MMGVYLRKCFQLHPWLYPRTVSIGGLTQTSGGEETEEKGLVRNERGREGVGTEGSEAGEMKNGRTVRDQYTVLHSTCCFVH